MLDEKFQLAYNLTYNTMATHKDVDTSMLRRAIWNYIHCMFGIRSVTCKAFILYSTVPPCQLLSLLLTWILLCPSGMTIMITGR